MSNIIRVVSSRSDSNPQIKNILSGIPSITNETIAALGLDELESRLTEMEQRLFQQAVTPTTGVSAGDVWYDSTNALFKVYREYPIGSGSYRWEPLVYKHNDSIDGGYW